jgi:RNA polymerase sigma factor (TIGR02999 family)
MARGVHDEPASSVTRLLQAWGDGDVRARDALMSLVYADLRRQAVGYLQRERSDHTLQPTALVHEAFMRLLGQKCVAWQNRAHFFGIAAQMMRRILVDHARECQAAKRPPLGKRVEFDEGSAVAMPPDVEVLMLDAALQQLASAQPRQAQIVELRYFGGLSEDDVAAVLAISRATVTREWQAARAWLYRRMTGEAQS